MKSWLLLAALIFVSPEAMAQRDVTPIPTSSGNSVHAATIQSTSSKLFDATASGHERVYIRLANQSSTATVRCAWGNTAAVNADTAGQETLLPYAQMVWEGNYTPNDQLNCISSAGPSPLTYQIGP